MTIALVVLLALEFAFRVFLEIREARLFNKMVPLAFLRCVPLLNDFAPFPELRNTEGENAKVSKFQELHEEGHKARHHALLRNMAKASFYSLMVIMILVMLTSWAVSFFEIILWFHLANGLFRLLYHAICWNQEDEADAYAAKKLGKFEARKELSRLAKSERPMSGLFAFMYREHPRAKSRRAKYQ